MSSYVSKEAIRVKVKKCEPNLPPEWRKFSVDPQITTVEVLYSILAKAFEIKSDFSISYRAVDPNGKEQFLPVLSDWDLEAAFLRTHNYSIQCSAEPCLNLKVDVKPFAEASDWEINSPASQQQSKQEAHSSIQQSLGVGQKYVQNMQNKLPGLIMNQMEKTFSLVQRALNLAEEQIPVYPPRPPLSDSEFRGFLDSVGQILKPQELRRVIFLGGIDPSLRRVVWKHILNVYPSEMTGKQRMDYMKVKASEYYRLRDIWKIAIQKGSGNGELAYVTSMVRKDVLRTDRLHPFYAGNDDNQNIASLFNILTTYALNHPSVSYCQGMSDLASPLLVTMNDEAHAYICFCAIMTRLKANFMLDGIAMTQKFTHLTEALQYYDPEFYDYLKAQQADDLLFCYRWLLLELKREFPFEDSLRMLEVQWSSLRQDFPQHDLKLIEKEFVPPTICSDENNESNINAKGSGVILRKPRESNYVKVCALRRQSSSSTLVSSSHPMPNHVGNGKLDESKRLNQSLDESCTSNKIKVKSNQSLDEGKMLQLAVEKVSIFESPRSDDEDDLQNFIEPTFILHPTNPFLDEKVLDELGKKDEINSELWLFSEKTERNKKIDENISLDPNIKTMPDEIFAELDHTVDLFVNESEANSLNLSEIEALHNNTVNHVENPETVIDLTIKTESSQIESKSSPNKKTVMKNSNTKCSSSQILHKQINNINRKGHFKDLKERIAAGKKGILASLDKMENQFDPNEKQKVVKNFNEFLNFTSINKNKISNKLGTQEKLKNFEKSLSGSETSLKSLKYRPLNISGKECSDESDSINSLIDQENHFNKVKKLQLTSIVPKNAQNISIDISPDDSQDYYPMTTSITREYKLDMENLDRQLFGNNMDRQNLKNIQSDLEYEKLYKDSLELVDIKPEEIIQIPELLKDESLKRISTCSSDQFVWENPLHQISNVTNELDEGPTLTNGNQITPDEQQDLEYDGEIILENGLTTQSLRLVKAKRLQVQQKDDSDDSSETEANWKQSDNFNPFLKDFEGNSLHIIDNTFMDDSSNNIAASNPQIGEEAAETEIINVSNETNNYIYNQKKLPPPNEFGGGNPFLMFLSLTLLLQHRNTIIKNAMDYNEIAMHFDKMIRKHDVTRVLNQARRMYFEYLKSQQLLLKKTKLISRSVEE